MKHKLSVYSGLLGALFSLGVVQAYAGEVAGVQVVSYKVATAVAPAATAEPVSLRELLRAPAFNVIDPINEFSGRDWRGLTPLGRTVTHEMRAAAQGSAAKAAAEFEETARAGLY